MLLSHQSTPRRARGERLRRALIAALAWAAAASGAACSSTSSFRYSDCEPRETRVVECGLNGRGEREETCQSDGRWPIYFTEEERRFYDCEDPDVCTDGAQEHEACELEDLGRRPLSCVEGQLEVVGPCEPIAIGAGGHHTCAARESGRMMCWGRNAEGQLSSLGTIADQPLPVVLFHAELDDIVVIGAGMYHTCAVRRITGGDTRALCWGRNYEGQVGNGTTGQRQLFPAPVARLTSIVAISAGYHQSCAVRESGGVRCWGSAYAGQLGNGDSEGLHDFPVPVDDLDDAVDVSAGNGHTCALRATGEIACWGDNLFGQLGNGESGEDEHETRPVSVLGVEDATAVAAGNGFTCALRETGAVLCWGNGHPGSLGSEDAGVVAEPEPLEVTGLGDAIAISAGGSHACAIRESGALVCWGRGEEGQLGAGHEITGSRTPVSVMNVDDAIGVEAGYLHTCAIRATGEAVCWGAGTHGELGDGESEPSFVPVPVAVPPDVDPWEAFTAG